MKQYTMKEFIKGKFAVKVNKNNCKNFLELCAKHRLRWASGENANEFTVDFDIFERGIVIIHEKRLNGMRLAYMVPNYAGYGVPVIDYKDFEDKKAPNCYQILIDCDGTTTTATMTINGREIKTAIARRNPADKFNWRKGAELAFERLWNSPKKLGEKPEVREVKRWAKPGEYIKIVAKKGYRGEKYQNGDVLHVHHYYNGEKDGWVMPDFETTVIGPKEYVVLEGYRPCATAAKKPSKEE